MNHTDTNRCEVETGHIPPLLHSLLPTRLCLTLPPSVSCHVLQLLYGGWMSQRSLSLKCIGMALSVTAAYAAQRLVQHGLVRLTSMNSQSGVGKGGWWRGRGRRKEKEEEGATLV